MMEIAFVYDYKTTHGKMARQLLRVHPPTANNHFPPQKNMTTIICKAMTLAVENQQHQQKQRHQQKKQHQCKQQSKK